MQVFRWMRSNSMRAICFALFLCAIPASSRAGVLISVGFAPPVLPVYTQPPCPQPGWMWTPGYWAYGPDGYYWVPGTWVPAPYEGALWTPPYWGWSGGLYVFHPGYWGPHVGYYGGVNYGFGFFGVGFVGGAWHGRNFAYNTAVVNVNRTVIRNVYVDRTVIVNHTVVNNRVAFSGGPGGVNHRPTPEENAWSHEHHMAPTSFQTQHRDAAMHNTNAYVSHNGGHPQNPAVSRPMTGNGRPANSINNNAPRSNTMTGHEDNKGGTNPFYEQRGNQNFHQPNQGQFNPGQHGSNPPPPRPQQNQWQHQQPQPQQNRRQQPQPQQHQWQPQPEQHQQRQPQPQQHQQQPQQHQQQPQHNNPQPHEDHGGGNQGHEHGH